ncbi:DUF397 domain-containing protein [Microbispora bryophytorum]
MRGLRRHRREPMVAVRDSKDRSGPVLAFTPSEWSAFDRVQAVRYACEPGVVRPRNAPP